MKLLPIANKYRVSGAIQVEVLLLLILLPLGGFLFVAAERKRRADLARFAGSRGGEQGQLRERRAEFFCFIAAVGMIVLALSRPSFSEVLIDVASEGRDVVFLLDVSRSMLADDVPPDRLESAKIAIKDCLRILEGDRVGLVVFAGSASILCPLTTDYGFFLERLEEAHPDYIAPGDVRVGGTRIGDALNKTAEKLLSHERSGFQDLILISDGGDQESAPERAGGKLADLGVYLIVAGIGDKFQGARVPARSEDGQTEFTSYDGREVWSKLDSASLERIARSCRNGVYLEAGTKALPLGAIYPELVKHFRKQHPEKDETMTRRRETFPLFLAAALVLLAPPLLRFTRSKPALVTALLPFALVGPGLGQENGSQLYNRGCEQLAAKHYALSLESFMQAADAFPDTERSSLAIYNAGMACFRQAYADELPSPETALTYYAQAVRCFRACLQMRPGWQDAAWNLELALIRLANLQLQFQRQSDRNQQQENKPDAADQDREGESEQDSDDSDWEDSDEEGTGEMAEQASGSYAMDAEAQGIPPPTVEPEDIFEQERQNADLRQKRKSANYKPVEKDW